MNALPRRLALALLALLALAPALAHAEEPARLFWRFQKGQSHFIELKSMRVVRDESGGRMRTSRREMSIAAVLNILEAKEVEAGAKEPAGEPAKGEIVFVSIDGSIQETDKQEIVVKETEDSLKEKKVPFTIGWDGKLQADEQALAKIEAHLPGFFAGLFVALPQAALKPGDTWTREGMPDNWSFKLESLAMADGRNIATLTGEASDGKPSGSATACSAKGDCRMTFDVEAGYAQAVTLLLDTSWVNDDGGGASTKFTTHVESSLKVTRRMR